MAPTIHSLEPEVISSGENYHEVLAGDVMAGLSASQKYIPAKYHYDAEGSRLFNRITELPEYYLTSCEMDAMHHNRERVAAFLQDGPVNLIEFGPGDGSKTMPLIGYLLRHGLDIRYVGVDISRAALRQLASDFQTRFPDCPIDCLAADYLAGLKWLSKRTRQRNLVLFLGSSIGNFSPAQARSFLRSLHDSLNDGDLLITGFDRVKEPELIHRAYNDSENVTAAFNLNVLSHINRVLDGEFDISRFTFEGRYDTDAQVVRSYLRSLEGQDVRIGDLGCSFQFDRGESIHTEDSHKYRESDIEALATQTGFRVESHLYDTRRYFIDSVWEVVRD